MTDSSPISNRRPNVVCTIVSKAAGGQVGCCQGRTVTAPLLDELVIGSS
jgi:hypothetical protein